MEDPAASSRDGTGEAAGSVNSILPKACQNCRIRKIRCDKSSPCSSCRIANLPCRHATVTKTADNRARIVSANSQEKHFNLIHDSLLEIKQKLQKLDQSHASPRPLLDVFTVTTEKTFPSVPETAFQGESSFDSHSAEASLSAEFSAREINKSDLDHGIDTSLSSLKSLLRGLGLPSSANDLSFPHSSTKPTATEVELPPVSIVLAVLRRTAVQAPSVFLQTVLRDHTILEEICRKVYFPTTPFSKGDLTLANGVLFYLLVEYRSKESVPGLSSSDCAKYAELCEKNFVAGLQDYECLITPALENIQCLMVGAMKAQQDSRPYLCWTFVSAGARLCQILGYHRQMVVARDPPKLAETKRQFFWMLYMMDKALSLNLGRTSCFPDYDIDVDLCTPSLDTKFRPWDQTMVGFVEFSRLQGCMYDDLYSAKARRQQPEIRSKAIEELSSRLSAWHVSFKEIDTTGAQDKDDLDLIMGSSDFIYYSILNLLYGAKTSPTDATCINARRYEAARLSLQCHIQNCAKLPHSDTAKWRVYSDWILLYSSFTPFLVVFTHSLASRSEEDVTLLSHVLLTLEAVRSKSEALHRLYQVCSVFLVFAKAFVQSQQPSFGFYNQEDDSFTFPPLGGDTWGQDSGLGSGNDAMMTEGIEIKDGDLESMSMFLGTYLGDNEAMGGLWNVDFSGGSGI